MRFRRTLISAFFILFANLGWAQSPADFSLLETAYTNHYFGFRYDISPSWAPQTEDAKRQMSELLRVRLNPNPDTPGSDLDTSGKKVFYNLLTLTRSMPSSDGRSSRAVIAVLAEDLSFDPSLTSSKDVTMKLTTNLAKYHYLPTKEGAEVVIGGRSFFRQDLKRSGGTGAPYEAIVFSVVRGHALGVVLLAPSPQALSSMVSGLNKLEFLRPAE